MFKKIIICLGLLLLGINTLWAASAGPESVEVAVTVIGSVFTLDLQDSSGYPWSGQLNLGSMEPGGEAIFPPDAVVVAACKSNRATPWELQIEGSQLTDEVTGKVIPEDNFYVRGYDSVRTGGSSLPGVLNTVPRSIKEEPISIYTSDSTGDSGFNNNYGSYVPLGFGVKVPDAQPRGTYTARITFIMTE
ncbi:MAG: hypothetical protein KKA19_07705 [Candidatus Margulisbacteria bacterium]|nr:hypothetical protein [Candidatus Margulisiibacteriota bacterium]